MGVVPLCPWAMRGSIYGRRPSPPWGYAHKNRFKGPLLLCPKRAKASPIIILSLCRLINSVSVSFENFPQKKFRGKGCETRTLS